MSRKRQKKRDKRLAQEPLQPEDSPLMDCPPAHQFVKACRYKGLQTLATFVADMSEKRYHAFWRVACFFILQPKKDGTQRHADDEQIWNEFANMNSNLKDPYLTYIFKQKMNSVINSDNARRG